LRDRQKWALETEHLTLWELCEGEPGGEAPISGDPEGYVKEGSGNMHLSP